MTDVFGENLESLSEIPDAFAGIAVSSQPPGVVLALSPWRPAIAFVAQYGVPTESGGACRPGVQAHRGPLLWVGAAATFGLRGPETGATVASFMPSDQTASAMPGLRDLVGLLMREAAVLPTRFRECGFDVFLCGIGANHDGAETDSDDAGMDFGDVAGAFRIDRTSAAFPRVTHLVVSDLAGHRLVLPMTLYALPSCAAAADLPLGGEWPQPPLGRLAQRLLAADQARAALVHGCGMRDL